jgi:hypothetical protein
MALKTETEAYLARAERNRAVARALCEPSHALGLHPQPLEWAAIAAFYAAVHYVNAFVWERFGQSPGDHQARRGFVSRTAPLNQVLRPYDLLMDLGWQARYALIFRPSPQLRQAVYARLDDIRATIYQGLGVSAS